jgi:hypothetical protein
MASLDSNQTVNTLFLSFSRTVQRADRSYPNLSQCAELRAQTVQSLPNVVYTYQWIRSEPKRNHPS